MKKLILLFSFIMIIYLAFSVSCVEKEMPVTETYYETEYKTEYKTETYTETESVIIETIDGEQEIFNSAGWFSAVLSLRDGAGIKTHYFHYVIGASEHTRSRVKIVVYPATRGYIAVYDLTGIGEIYASPTPSQLDLQLLAEQRIAWFRHLNSILEDKSRLLGSYKQPLSGQIDEHISNEITFDVNEIKEFAIFTDTRPQDNVIKSVELSWSDDIVEKKAVTKERQVPYEVPVQVEEQRTVMQMKKVPFWEAIFSK